MERWRFGWGVAAGLFVGLLLLSARQANAQGGSAEALNVPSLQALGKVPELDEPLKEFRTGNVVGALQLLRAAVKKNPDLPPPQVILAAWLAEVSQPGMARTALETATLEVPDDPEPYLILADLALRDRQVAEVSLLLGKGYDLLAGTTISPKRAAVLKRRALVALAALADSRRDWKQAQKYLESLLADDPKNASALEQLGRVLFQLKKPDEALAKLQEAAKLDPANILAPEATLAQLYQQSGDKENAAKWMVAAIKANPRDARVRRVAAQWSVEIGRLDQAEEQAKAARAARAGLPPQPDRPRHRRHGPQGLQDRRGMLWKGASPRPGQLRGPEQPRLDPGRGRKPCQEAACPRVRPSPLPALSRSGGCGRHPGLDALQARPGR